MFDSVHPRPTPKAGSSGPHAGSSTLSSLAGVIDVAGSLQRMGGDMELFCEFVSIYDEDAPALIDRIRTAVGKGDPAGLHRAAHTLKGLVSNFGAHRAVDAAYVLERMGRDGPPAGASSAEALTKDEALQALESELARLNEALAPFRAS